MASLLRPCSGDAVPVEDLSSIAHLVAAASRPDAVETREVVTGLIRDAIAHKLAHEPEHPDLVDLRHWLSQLESLDALRAS